MYICSAIAQQCSPGIIKPGEYTTEHINEYQILTKFACIEQPGKDT